MTKKMILLTYKTAGFGGFGNIYNMEFWKDNWQAVIGTLTTIITGLAAWFGGRKIKKSNEKTEEATALKNMQEVYDTLTKQIQNDFNNLREEVKDLKAENRDQRKGLMALQKDNSKLHLEVSGLMQENNKLKMQIAELRKENQELRESKANKVI
ncbi:hypothetical protein [Zunongwangia profunda]|uniref:hypothetical protein n=1 Tax=Zunongwangia profunda TaxID=398743 RepID=UPI00248E1E51|nr:hypothetical protein [Zunongwangia profunda]